ncbi:MAG: GPW/gp25 family protein [Nostoc sp. DedQUE12b]|uniref:GPW/gp25 family protein n=1 Tax=Nostoc sp. DedQUE12b TaxID=3075398 RepID=UPI002AD5173F|nr:GPW/gp25 family protein [Nostoc sp. DedQUE12b]MDZ8086061.1 GPW/gp25 family protein [Nostoc sp. DedQUE12b]
MSEENNETHLGKGWAFPLGVSVQGTVQQSSIIPNIEESILIILRTRLGERVYRPDFGCRLEELIFAPMNTQTLLLAKLYTQEALVKWEPRIILDAVRTEPDPVRGRLDIIIEYHPRNSHEQRSLVFPFYLMANS